ncbi:PELOTA 1 isoform X1 [Chlorella sorokiniana]|uniref:Protein pelota homolog n=1 Tax=Chlorella sorokiniana TaxID=3076 RepID=A0A2P6U2V7_CHLSO|nr:PELOTA 1 isoform X1 [Chlorella sorokiniana]|eukprot:PRW60647.1 PELOTA 1 isoform X1 [Chlorella sorokiniana]
MKLLTKQLLKEGPGFVKMVPEEGEDLWHAYNLIREGDRVEATTFRKVQTDRGTGSESERVKLKLMVRVEGVEYDAEGQQIRLKGKNMTENEHVKLGAYHTLELELQRAFTLHKDVWDSVDAERVRTACDPAASADLAVVLITEGLAHLCLVGSTCTLTRAKIEANIPRKRGAAAAGYDKAMESFYDKVFAAIVRHVDWDIVRCLVIAGPGFAKDEFREYLDKEAQRREARTLLLNRSKILLAPASSAYKHSIKEVLAGTVAAGQIKDTKAAREVQALQDFMTMLGQDPSRAFYGPGHVHAAHEMGAIQTLLITDSLFRTTDIKKRKKMVALVDEVTAGGGTVHVFSGMHASGEQLNQLTGIAAILRFPLPDLEDQEFEADW